ncbi:DUF1496 domain-containing protein [Vibrio pectenicida]|uniref:DUF1496 domain-containing protein n=1 Tax=Vibrio pectenicida TaxID=62763 RepID=A0A3R9E0D7_9VIBR|nr:DUF1496 domain-containing protein [Vibrio pectenicida]RSD31397.1 DUF1496 domain-containing protein [Vibrio pectenicida]
MRSPLLTLLLLISGPTSAYIITTPGKPVVAIDASNTGKRVCYYQDQAYSLGAILQVGDHYMTCDRANDFETNGALKWLPLDKQNQAESINQEHDPSVKTYSVK